MRPLFGPDQKPLGHPATTRYLAQLDREEDAALARIRQAEAHEQTYRRGIQTWIAALEGKPS